MRCNEFQEKIIEYLENSLSDKEHQAFLSHLAECESCRQELAQAKKIDALLIEKMPAYSDEIVPSDDFAARLQRNGPWDTPKKPSFWEWLLAPRQSRRIVTVALSTALIVSLAILGPQVYTLRTAEPAPNVMSSEDGRNAGEKTFSLNSTALPDRTSQSSSSDTGTIDNPGLMASAGPSATEISLPTSAFALITLSSNGNTNSESFVITGTSWELSWSIISGPASISIKIIDSDSGTELGQLSNNISSSGTTIINNQTGSIHLAITADDATFWELQVIPAS